MTSYPPGPSSNSLVQTLRWTMRPIGFMEECRRKYGDNFSLMFLNFETPMVMVSDPEVIKAIYSERANGMPPGRVVVLEPVMGSRSILLLEGRDHLMRRKLMLPSFHGERMRSYEQVMREAITTEIDSWEPGTSFPIHSRMQSVTLEVILRAVFGVEEGARAARLREQLGTVLHMTAAPTLQLLGFATRRFKRGPWASFQRQLGEVDRELLAMIAERRADPALADREDILSMLLEAKFEPEDGETAPQGMSDDEVRDQLMTLLLAGHETTATALAWTFDLLLRNPAAYERLRSEIRDGGDEYLKATISEALRLRPVVPLAGRRLAADLTVDGLDLPAGTDVSPAIWLTHTRPDLYPEPYAFRPERFLEKSPETYGWIPFGGGVRRCLGAAFAEFEMRVVLEEVLGRCEFAPVAGRPQRVGRRNITLSPKQGTPVGLLSKQPTSRKPALA
jgi:cytochrome P450 family 135